MDRRNPPVSGHPIDWQAIACWQCSAGAAVSLQRGRIVEKWHQVVGPRPMMDARCVASHIARQLVEDDRHGLVVADLDYDVELPDQRMLEKLRKGCRPGTI